MQKKLAIYASVVLSLGWVAVNGVLQARALMGNDTLVNSPTVDAHASQSVLSTPQLSPTPVTGAFFALSVADVNASAGWYTEKLGLKVIMPLTKSGPASVIVLEGSGLIVELIQHDDAAPLSKAAPTVKANYLVHGIFKAGVIVEDFDKTLAMLRERNVPIAFGPFPAKSGQRANVIIRDNAGNLIQFFGK
jgi:catechol 2,3-dioxygenase-like lactoylglutathione lyase family enzyme